MKIILRSPLRVNDIIYNPKPKTDYKLTSAFAKKLSMTGNTEKHDQARQYFLACEQGLKIATQKLQSVNYQPLLDAITVLTQKIASIQRDINSLKPSSYLTGQQYPSSWYKKIAPKFKLLMEYFTCTRNELYSNIYKEIEDTYNVDINQIHEDFCYANRLPKEEVYLMTAIEHTPQIRDAITLLIDTSLIKYGLRSGTRIKRQTLFDRKPSHES